MRVFIALLLFLSSFLEPLAADGCPNPGVDALLDSTDQTRYFVVANVDPAGDGFSSELPFGTVVAASRESTTTVSVGNYRVFERCFTKLFGPVPRYAFVESLETITVGEAVSRHPELAEQMREDYPLARPWITERNAVPLRVLLPPGGEFRPRFAPDPQSAENPESAIGDTFFWRYVVDVRTGKDGALWFLLSTHSHLTGATLFETDRETARVAMHRLQGWVPAATVEPWPTNIVLELNASQAAVEHRIRFQEGRDLAVILADLPTRDDASKLQGSRVVAQTQGIEVRVTESAKFWDPAFAWEQLRANNPLGHDPHLPRFLPEGLAGSTVRAHVQAYETSNDEQSGWTRVTTLARLHGALDVSEWTRVQRAMLEVIAGIAQIELVFVLDGTGSIKGEIASIGRALELLGTRLHDGADPFPDIDLASFRTLRKLHLSELPVDIRASLLIFSDVTHEDIPDGELVTCRAGADPRPEIPRTGYIFRRLSVRNELDSINEGIRTALCLVTEYEGRGAEATLHALERVVGDTQIWGDRLIGQQVIILVTDEAATEGTVDPDTGRGRTPDGLKRTLDEVVRADRARAEAALDEGGFPVPPVWRADDVLIGQVGKLSADPEIRKDILRQLESDEIAPFRMWLIFTGDEEQRDALIRQLRPSGLFSREQLYWENLDGVSEASHQALAVAPHAVGKSISDEQAHMVRIAVGLENCTLDPERCPTTITRRPSHASAFVVSHGTNRQRNVGYTVQRSGIDHATVEKHVETGFRTGYTRIREPGSPYSTWSQAMMVTERQMREYVDIMKGFIFALEAYRNVSVIRRQGTRCDWPKAEVARLLYFFQTLVKEPPSTDREAMARVRDEFRDPDLCEFALQLLHEGLDGPLAQALGLPSFLPVHPKGLFGLSFEEVNERISNGTLTPEGIVRDFLRKAYCLQWLGPEGRLINARALDPDQEDPGQYCASGADLPPHQWAVRLSHRYGGSYVFIPLHLLL